MSTRSSFTIYNPKRSHRTDRCLIGIEAGAIEKRGDGTFNNKRGWSTSLREFISYQASLAKLTNQSGGTDKCNLILHCRNDGELKFRVEKDDSGTFHLTLIKNEVEERLESIDQILCALKRIDNLDLSHELSILNERRIDLFLNWLKQV
jgi:hypothetical protein